MAIRLVFLGRLRDIAGASERFAAPAATLDEVLAGLPPPLAVALAEDCIRIAINGTLVGRAGLALADDDEVAFLPPVSGG